MMAWYFLQTSACDTRKALLKFKREIGMIGRVRTCAIGTAVDPRAGWFVLRANEPDIAGLRARLGELGLNGYVNLIEPLARPQDGLTLARQLALF